MGYGGADWENGSCIPWKRCGFRMSEPHTGASSLIWEPWEVSHPLPRWCAAGEGAREARGVGRVWVAGPEVPAGGKAGGLPTRLGRLWHRCRSTREYPNMDAW
jgi:hypothetical protein